MSVFWLEITFRTTIKAECLNIYATIIKTQGMGCEGACAHADVRCAVARVRVRAKSIFKSVCDVRVCGSFLHTFAHFLEQNGQKKLFLP
jgi:hypothetical protein